MTHINVDERYRSLLRALKTYKTIAEISRVKQPISRYPEALLYRGINEGYIERIRGKSYKEDLYRARYCVMD